MKQLFNLLMVAAICGSPAHAATAGDTTILRAAKIYTAPDAQPIDNGVIVMREGRIAQVGTKEATEAPPGSAQTNCNGGVVTAGFQNSHVHFTESKWEQAADQKAAQLAKNLAAMLTRYGFTTVVDTASDVDNTVALRKRIEKGEVPGPRILTAGWALYPPNGIPFYLKSMPPEVLKQLRQPASADEALSDLRENFKRGADLTKLFIATPQADNTIKYMPPAIAKAAVVETHRRSRLVFAHPTDVQGIRAAMAAGVDVLAHTTLGNQKLLWEPDLVQEMITHDIAVIPTLKLWRYEMTKGHVPEKSITLAVGDTLQQLQVFSEAGGQVLFGTDVGYMTDYDPTDEYVLMLKAGLTSMQILASLTTAPAARFKEDDRRGRIAPGMDADLVVLDADPAQDIRNFAKARCVFRGGLPIYTAPAASPAGNSGRR
ncbi:MAG TPA: amidohydrolase family protein [Steroidobacteraceae bacterium]|nr:amidohydrolase family protein [Steroidobacteraceae bacterium]